MTPYVVPAEPGWFAVYPIIVEGKVTEARCVPVVGWFISSGRNVYERYFARTACPITPYRPIVPDQLEGPEGYDELYVLIPPGTQGVYIDSFGDMYLGLQSVMAEFQRLLDGGR